MLDVQLTKLRELYQGDSDAANRFRYGILFFDLLTIAFVVGTSFTERTSFVLVLDVVIGAVLLAEFCARLLIARQRARFLLHPVTIADIVAIASFLASVAGGDAGFLRILRTLRLLHSYELLDRLERDVPFVARREEVVLAAINLGVFLFVMTGLIFATQHRTNPEIGNYVDALYFTVTTLTTTGFGDIILEGTWGRLLSVLVMIVGVTLFLRLAQVVFRPRRVRHVCPTCGLERHDVDAVHCKHCGTTLNIRTEGVF